MFRGFFVQKSDAAPGSGQTLDGADTAVFHHAGKVSEP